MEYYILDGEKMLDRKSLHEYLKEVLMLPEYYGNNLDALYDCLTEFGSDVTIEIINYAKIVENLGEYGQILIEVLETASNNEDSFVLKIEQ